MSSKYKLDKTYIDMATCLSYLSTAKRMKVGALLVKDTRIISEGYNGTITGFDNCCEYTDFTGFERTKAEVIHAEQNALSKIARSSCSSDGSTLYVTLSPCIDCAKNIIQCGIVRVVYKELYVSDGGRGLSLLSEAGVQVEKFKYQR